MSGSFHVTMALMFCWAFLPGHNSSSFVGLYSICMWLWDLCSRLDCCLFEFVQPQALVSSILLLDGLWVRCLFACTCIGSSFLQDDIDVFSCFVIWCRFSLVLSCLWPLWCFCFQVMAQVVSLLSRILFLKGFGSDARLHVLLDLDVSSRWHPVSLVFSHML